MKLKKFSMTVKIDKADWKCEYCTEPLDGEAITTISGYAHPECDPLYSLLMNDIMRAYDREFGHV